MAISGSRVCSRTYLAAFHRLFGVRKCVRVLFGLLPRLLRNCFHHHSATRPGGGEDGHRSDLVRRADRGEHANLVYAPALRLCAVLFALDRAAFVKSEEILWGSIPWVIIMLIMVVLVIMFPG